MKNIAINPATYKKLLKFATAGGNPDLIAVIIGNSKPAVITAYLDHMNATDHRVYKLWGSKLAAKSAKPPVDDDDPTLDLGDDDDEPVVEPEAPPAKKTKKAAPEGETRPIVKNIPEPREGFMLFDGKEYPAKFRLRNPDGFDTELEIFSALPHWGIIVRVPVPADKRKIMLASGEVEVDLLALKRDPSGKTTLNGKVYTNSKLIAAAELDEE